MSNVQCSMFNVQCERVTQWVECAAGCIFSSKLLYTSLPTVGATFPGGPSPLYTLVHFYLGLGSLCWFINAFGGGDQIPLVDAKDTWCLTCAHDTAINHSTLNMASIKTGNIFSWWRDHPTAPTKIKDWLILTGRQIRPSLILTPGLLDDTIDTSIFCGTSTLLPLNCTDPTLVWPQ